MYNAHMDIENKKLTEKNSKSVSVRLPNNYLSYLKKIAKKQDIGVSIVIRQIIAAYLSPCFSEYWNEKDMIRDFSFKETPLNEIIVSHENFIKYYESLTPLYKQAKSHLQSIEDIGEVFASSIRKRRQKEISDILLKLPFLSKKERYTILKRCEVFNDKSKDNSSNWLHMWLNKENDKTTEFLSILKGKKVTPKKLEEILFDYYEQEDYTS